MFLSNDKLILLKIVLPITYLIEKLILWMKFLFMNKLVKTPRGIHLESLFYEQEKLPPSPKGSFFCFKFHVSLSCSKSIRFKK